MSAMQELTKGANAPVPADAVLIRVRWSTGPAVPDVDVSALLCGTTGKVSSDHDFIFYNQPTHPSGSVRHLGKSSAGTIATDLLGVNLTQVPTPVDKVVIATSADGTFGQVPGLSVEVLDARGDEPLLRFPMTATSEAGLIVGELYRHAGRWKFRAVGQGYNDGLAGLARDFGITVDDAPTQSATPVPGPASAPSDVGAPAPVTAPGLSGGSGGIDWLNPPVPVGYDN